MSTAVVHLVRRGNPPEAFDAFLRSYEQHPAGHPHDLVLLCKGFRVDDELRSACLARALDAAPSARAVDVPDTGFDLTAYAAAARTLPHQRVCFLNSYSELLAGDWLAKLAAGLDEPGVGVSGASGSWESTLSLAAYLAGLRSAYSAVFDDRTTLVRLLHEMGGTQPASALAERLFAGKMMLIGARQFPRYPNAHVRTNAILIDRETFASLRIGNLANKRDAYRFESGRDGLTAQLAGRGQDAVVVDRHGTARPPEHWHEADVFRQGHQADLLVADNQTRTYAEASTAARVVLSRCAWGLRACPD